MTTVTGIMQDFSNNENSTQHLHHDDLGMSVGKGDERCFTLFTPEAVGNEQGIVLIVAYVISSIFIIITNSVMLIGLLKTNPLPFKPPNGAPIARSKISQILRISNIKVVLKIISNITVEFRQQRLTN